MSDTPKPATTQGTLRLFSAETRDPSDVLKNQPETPLQRLQRHEHESGANLSSRSRD